MSQSRPTLSSPSRECPSLTACARSSVLPYVTPKWGHSDQPRTANPGKAHRRCWCFLDHAGPTVFSGNSSGMDVGPHPHIGLQTFTG